MTDEHFNPITDTAALDALFTASAERPIILFKHDPYCPISAAAYEQMEQTPASVAIIDVEHDKEIARTVTERTGVRHESPQVIVLKDGEAAWSASQFRIKAKDVARVVDLASPTP